MVTKGLEGNEYLSRFNEYGYSVDSFPRRIVFTPEEAEWE